jgi:hypothetical protein
MGSPEQSNQVVQGVPSGCSILYEGDQKYHVHVTRIVCDEMYLESFAALIDGADSERRDAAPRLVSETTAVVGLLSARRMGGFIQPPTEERVENG